MLNYHSLIKGLNTVSFENIYPLINLNLNGNQTFNLNSFKYILE